MKSPAFQFYADDFIGGTCDLSAEEVGAYVRLLCYQWNKGSIAIAEPSKLSRIAGCEVSADVLAKFPGGKNVRLEEVRAKQEEFRANRSEAGKQGARARWNHDSTANSEANGSAITQPMASGMAKNSSPSPTPTPYNTEGASAPPLPFPDKPAAESEPAIELPFPSPQFAVAWELFRKHRTELKKPLRGTSTKLALEELKAMGEERAIIAIRHTIAKGWQGIREPEQQRSFGQPAQSYPMPKLAN